MRGLHTSRAHNGPWEGAITKPMNRYIIIAEDYPNPGALARRLEVRDQHMSDVRKGVEAGRVGEHGQRGGDGTCSGRGHADRLYLPPSFNRSELAGGLLSRDFADLSEDSSPVYSLCGSVFVVQGEVRIME